MNAWYQKIFYTKFKKKTKHEQIYYFVMLSLNFIVQLWDVFNNEFWLTTTLRFCLLNLSSTINWNVNWICCLLTFARLNSEAFRGILSPRTPINENKPSYFNWWSKRYSAALLFPLFHSCTPLQNRLSWDKLIRIEARSTNSGYMDEKVRQLLALLNLSLSLGGLFLLCEQIIAKLCSVLELLPNIAQTSPHLK